MKNSRDIKDLLPVVAAKCEAFIAECKKQGIDVLITSTLRDNESQAAIYAVGRTVMGANPTPKKPMGDTVTGAMPGRSFHNYRCAFDFVPIVNGKAMWNDNALFTKCGVIAEGVGLEWSGRWKNNNEKAHCQYTGGLKIEDLQSGKKIL